MGSIRTLLAIAVVFAHSYGFVFVGGRLAVQLFYTISGFLISFVLTEANTYKSPKAFYVNRFLRLFPVYWAVALLTLLAVAVGYMIFDQDHQILSVFSSVGWAGRIALALSNFTIFGQDWIMFTGVRDGALQLVADFHDSEIVVWTGLLVPQAWTLGVELSFYLLAPFILTRRSLIVVFLFASLGVRAYLIIIGLGMQDPWTYRFFPAELALFLLGSLSHQLWMPYLQNKGLLKRGYVDFVVVFMFAYCTVFFLLPYRAYNTLGILTLFVLSLPFLFAFQKGRRWDSAVGELSYPIYISHMLVIWTFRFLLNRRFGVDYQSVAGSIAIAVAAVLFGFSLNIAVGKKVDRWRQKVKDRQVELKPG